MSEPKPDVRTRQSRSCPFIWKFAHLGELAGLKEVSEASIHSRMTERRAFQHYLDKPEVCTSKGYLQESYNGV